MTKSEQQLSASNDRTHCKGKGVKKRGLKLEEYAIFVASVGIGHGHKDITGQFYADLDAVKRYQATKLN